MPDTYRVTTDKGIYNVTVDNSGVSNPTATDMIGMMGKAPAPVYESGQAPAPNLISRLRAIAEPMTEPWNQPTKMGKLSALTLGSLTAEAPNILRYFGSAAREAYANSDKLRQIPSQMIRTLYNRATDTRPLQEVMQSNFNELPLYQQMEHLPTTASGSAGVPGTIRSGMQRMSDVVPVSTGPHLDLTRPISPGRLTQAQIGERIRALQEAGGSTDALRSATRNYTEVTPRIQANPKPFVSAEDVARIRDLMTAGYTQDAAIGEVLGAR